MSELMMWRRIPPGSRLEVGVTPAGTEFAATGQVFNYGSNAQDESWTDAQIHPGPKSLTIQNARDYIVDIIVSFASAGVSQATVDARVVKADGNVFSQPDSAVLSGKNSDAPRMVTIVLISRKS
jgi:hypothetical protein